MADERRSRANELNLSNEMSLVEDQGEIMTGARDEVEELQAGPLSLFKERGFDPVTQDQHILMLHEMFQPHETEDGRYTCKICLQHGSDTAPIFENKSQFSSHRYRCHGTFMNFLHCPDIECDQQFSSIINLKKHLQSAKSLPIESHYKYFVNVSEFEIWRNTVEQVTGNRFILHNKQAQTKRNVMHCALSEHKITSGAKNRNGMGKMRKQGSVCPAHITFVENSTGSVDVVYQFFHYGHDQEAMRQFNIPSREDPFYFQRDESLPVTTIFPSVNRLPKSAVMQYVHLCLLDMPDALYLSARYSQLLIILDVQSYFIFAKPIPNPRSVSESVHKSHIIRQLVDVFTQFGCPVGFSVCATTGVLFDAMESIEEVLNVNTTHVGNVTPDLSFFKRGVLDRAVEELGIEERWPEVLPFVVHSTNTEGGGDKYMTPFEIMFGRRPPHTTDCNELAEDAQRIQHESSLAWRFQEGDYVLVRYFDSELVCEGPIPNASQPQPSTDYFNGLVGEVDWYGSPFYPYKVFICRSNEIPNTNCTSIWVSPFDVAPTVADLRKNRNAQRRSLAASLLCTCTDESSEKCMLVRSDLCVHKMSLVCCDKMETLCEYHSEYSNGGGDSYKRVEGLARRFIMRERYEKTEERKKEGRVLRQTEETGEEEERRVMIEERERRTPPIKTTPSFTFVKIRRKREDDGQLPSTSQLPVTALQRVLIAEKKPVIRVVKRRGEERNEDEPDEKAPTLEKMPSTSTLVGIDTTGESSISTGESNEDRRKSVRVSKPNTLYKSFVQH